MTKFSFKILPFIFFEVEEEATQINRKCVKVPCFSDLQEEEEKLLPEEPNRVFLLLS